MQRWPDTPVALDEPPNAYAVCTTPRSGSNLLCDLLMGSAVMGQPTEFFNARSTIRPIAKSRELFLPDQSIDMEGYVEHIRATKVSPNGMFGTKILFSQMKNMIAFGAGRELLTSPRTRYILLIREETIAQAISAYLARELDAWTLERERQVAEQGNPRSGVPYDRAKIAAELAQIAEHNESWLEFFEVNELEFLTVTYEDLLRDARGVCQAVCRYCGVETGYEFAVERARIKRQGDDLNRAFRQRFAADSGLNMRERASNGVVKAAGLLLREAAAEVPS
jgi:LPS sulfotransferase NodH